MQKVKEGGVIVNSVRANFSSPPLMGGEWKGRVKINRDSHPHLLSSPVQGEEALAVPYAVNS